MQSQPTEAPQSEPVETNGLPNVSTQHGLIHDLRLSSSLPVQQDATEELRQSAADIDTSSVSSGESALGRKHDSRRLTGQDRPARPSSPGSRVDQYEKVCLSTSPRDRVVSSGLVPSTQSVKNVTNLIFISQLPNEVLTHIFSHLPPSALSALSLVSRRFHGIVTTPHAWRIAFSRFFPGQHGADKANGGTQCDVAGQVSSTADRRVFARLTALASWRSEYILRTRLLRSLGRGKPTQFQPIGHPSSARGINGSQAAAVLTYSSNLVYPVSNIHASFGHGINKRYPQFMHGASEYGVVTVSDPSAGKVAESWGGTTDYSAFRHFEDSAFAGEAMWGLGAGEIAGLPNSLDLSHGYGRIYVEGLPGGRVFFTPVSDRRGVFLVDDSTSNHDLGIPDVSGSRRSVSCTWIAKSDRVLRATSGIFGLLVGYSNGILAAHALGTNSVYDRRYGKGEPAAKWVLSPGVPIIAVQVDEQVSSRRTARGRVWAVALNALGEIFYLSEVPSGPEAQGRICEDEANRLAWKTGRSARWTLIESSRRVARPDPFHDAEIDGRYSPRSSSDAMDLTLTEVIAETKEIEKFISHKPKHFQKICEGWDMRRRLLVDFAGDDCCGAGESVFVLTCGLGEGEPAAMRRFTRNKVSLSKSDTPKQKSTIPADVASASPSLFGSTSGCITAPPDELPRSRTSSHDSQSVKPCRIEWRLSDYTLGGLKGVQMSATATDDSQLALITASEDPLLGMSGGSNTSSPLGSPLGNMPQPSTVSEIPGKRARLMAVGTEAGIILLWNMRVASSSDADIITSIPPIRVIYTESPKISCLALTSLYLVHGGNDGLVQAWDPLCSSTDPIRTLNSRFSSRARRRLIQAEASVEGIGNNYYAAGAVVLDPDPTVLRGMVSLGTHLRYWSYSSSAADQYKGSKRKLKRRSERGSNAASPEQRFTHTGREVLRDYIAHETQELEREEVMRRKEYERLSGRFGTNLLGPGATEEDMLAYATILSEESYDSNALKNQGSGEDSATLSSDSSDTLHKVGVSLSHDSTSTSSAIYITTQQEQESDPDVAEAIRLSLMEAAKSSRNPPSTTSHAHVPYNTRGAASRSPYSSPTMSSSRRYRNPRTHMIAKEDGENQDDDLDFALQLSLVEQQSGSSPVEDVDEEYPALGSPGSGGNKVKGK